MSSARAANAPIENDPFEMCDTEINLNGVDFEGVDIGAAGSIFGPTAIKLEDATLNDVQQVFLTRMDRMEQNMTFMLKRVFTEIIALRKENAILKAKVHEALNKNPAEPSRIHLEDAVQTKGDVDAVLDCEVDFDGSVTQPASFRGKDKPAPTKKPRVKPQLNNVRHRANCIIPENPLTVVEDFLKFELEINEDVDKEQWLVDQFAAMTCTIPDKYIRQCWRKLLSDEVAAKFCWCGTATKKSIRGMSVTLAIQTAFQQKFEDDGIFDRVTQKHFHFAPARLVKMARYHQKLKEV